MFAAAAVIGPFMFVLQRTFAEGDGDHLMVPAAVSAALSLLLVLRLGGLARVAQRRSAELDLHAGELERRGRDLAEALVDREALEHQLRHGALHDPTTGLANRALLTQRMEWALTRNDDQGRHALILLDLDRSPTSTTRTGTASATTSWSRSRPGCGASPRPPTPWPASAATSSRCSSRTSTRCAPGTLAEHLRAELKAPLTIGARTVHLTASLASGASRHRAAPRDAVADAELALRAAKRAGRDRVSVYRPELRTARETFTRISAGCGTRSTAASWRVHYQPVVELPSARIVAVEALLRWTPPSGPVPPLDFIPVAEETGMIVADRRVGPGAGVPGREGLA